MTTDLDRRDPSVRREYVSLFCCTPSTVFGGYLWGGLLVLIGGAWLLDTLELVPEALLELFWPLVVIGIGLASLGSAAIRGADRPLFRGR